MNPFLIGLVLILLIIGGWYFYFQTPSTERVWIEEQSRTSTVEINEDSVIIQNVRDWTYDTSGPLSKEWIDMEIDPSDIKQVWFLIEPFGGWKAVGHTFLSFELENGETVSFSIEARRERGETYQAILGAVGAYGLTYQWGTERDFITRRLVYLDHSVRMYPLTLPEGGAEALFRSLAEETNELAEKPRLYNTLTANCTSLLADMVNEHYPKTLPRHYSWNLTGYADTYLMREGFIEIIDVSETRTQERYDLTPYKEAIGYAGVLPATAFSDVVRLLLADKE